MSRVKVKQDPEKEIPAEIIAQSILDIADGMKRLNNTRLTRRALVTLIHDHSRVPRRDIELVLTNLEQMETIWLKKKTP